jgi:diguanylate cyclase (GGDEF)-like protein/PAS domain S-box-containing protein
MKLDLLPIQSLYTFLTDALINLFRYDEIPHNSYPLNNHSAASTRRNNSQNEYSFDPHLAAEILSNINDGVMVTDSDLKILEVNSVFTKITGYTRNEAIGQTPDLLSSGRHESTFYYQMWDLLQRTGHWQGEIWNKRKCGNVYPEWLSITRIERQNNNKPWYIAIFSDLSNQEKASNHIHYLAYYDHLTGLPNRTLFTDRLKLALSQAQRTGNHVGLFFLDIDRFKSINDSLGHTAGDALLTTIGRRLSDSMREYDTVSRLGGDEFTVVVSEIHNLSQIEIITNKIMDIFKEPIKVNNQELFVTTSVGISIYPQHGTSSEALLKNADIAMYKAKERGKNTYTIYDKSMSTKQMEWLSLETFLRRAMRADEISVVYQPQISAQSGRIAGIEALARWNQKLLGEIPPSKFIPIAEENGLIRQIGSLVLRTACEQVVKWQQAFGQGIRVAVNVSNRQLRYGDFVNEVSQVLLETGLSPSLLEIEITESELMESTEDALETVESLKKLGVQIAIDDFGTGYSSLSYLKQLSVDRLKIDRSFIRDLSSDTNDSLLVKTIIDMAHSLQLSVTAEGVETKEQFKFLHNNGCDEIQGYLIAKPMTADKVANLIRTL